MTKWYLRVVEDRFARANTSGPSGGSLYRCRESEEVQAMLRVACPEASRSRSVSLPALRAGCP
jgi:hypothetical protein